MEDHWEKLKSPEQLEYDPNTNNQNSVDEQRRRASQHLQPNESFQKQMISQISSEQPSSLMGNSGLQESVILIDHPNGADEKMKEERRSRPRAPSHSTSERSCLNKVPRHFSLQNLTRIDFHRHRTYFLAITTFVSTEHAILIYLVCMLHSGQQSCHSVIHRIVQIILNGL